MKLRTITIGSWFPKTIIHFGEFVNFLVNKAVIAELSQERAEQLWDRLCPTNIQVQNDGSLKHVSAESDGFLFRYHEDGLLTVSAPVKSLTEDKEKLLVFYRERLTPALAYIYSLGAKGLELIRVAGDRKRVYLAADSASETELNGLFGDKVPRPDKAGRFTAYSDRNQVLLLSDQPDAEPTAAEIVEHTIFCDEVQGHAKDLLQLHRRIWEDAEALINKTTEVNASVLPAINHRLVNYSNAVGNIRNRLKQMQANVSFRGELWAEQPSETESLVNFNSLKYTLDYLTNVFDMTALHLNNNVDYLRSAYNNAQQQLLNRLQFLFLISMVVSFISLGAFPSAKMKFADSTGKLIAQGDFLSFDLTTMIAYGSLTIAVTIAIYWIWTLMIKTKIKTPKLD